MFLSFRELLLAKSRFLAKKFASQISLAKIEHEIWFQDWYLPILKPSSRFEV